MLPKKQNTTNRFQHPPLGDDQLGFHFVMVDHREQIVFLIFADTAEQRLGTSATLTTPLLPIKTRANPDADEGDEPDLRLRPPGDFP